MLFMIAWINIKVWILSLDLFEEGCKSLWNFCKLTLLFLFSNFWNSKIAVFCSSKIMSLWGYTRKKVITVIVNFECHRRAALLYQRKIILQFDEIFVLSFSERGFSWFGAFLAASKRCIDFIKAKEKWQHKSFEIRTLEIEKNDDALKGKCTIFALWKSW